MKVPQIAPLPGMTPLGIKPYAQVLADKPLLAPKPQIACDHGLFSDDHLQLDLVEMLQDPTNES